MITLLTGSPGTGKTAWLISQLLLIKEQQPYREFFIHGIREFTGFKHQTIYCKSPLCDLCQSVEQPENALYVENYHQWFQPHYMIVVDEVQRIWGKSNGVNTTDAISRLQTHRHYGLDFWLVTQSPKLIHTDVKAMVGRHVHLVAKWNGRKQYEWDEMHEEINSRTGAVTRGYKLPKHVFKLYKSAEVHTKQEKRKPIVFYAVFALLAISVGLIIFTYNRLSERIQPEQNIVTNDEGAALAGSSSLVAENEKKEPDSQTESFDKISKSLTPVVPGLPWTAPIYKELSKPVSMPVLKGCVTSKDDDRCACFSQQGTVIDMPHDICIMYTRNLPFNHFAPDKNVNGTDPLKPAETNKIEQG